MNAEFQQNLVRQPERSEKKLFCSRDDCGKELGQRIPMNRGSDLFMINIKGVKFAKKDHDGFYSPTKWSKIEFKVLSF